MGDGAVVAFEVVLQHRLPVGARLPVAAAVQRMGAEIDAAPGDDVEHRPVAVLCRGRVRIEIDEHERPERLDPDGQQRKILQPEVRLGARSRRAAQPARQVVGPSVIAALHQRGVAAALHDQVAAMAADIDEACQSSVVAHDHHRHAAGVARDVVADLGELGQRPDIVPALAEDVQQLAARVIDGSVYQRAGNDSPRFEGGEKRRRLLVDRNRHDVSSA